MGRKADILNFVEGQMNLLKQEGCSQTVIASHLHISRNAVQNVLRFPPADGLPRRRKTDKKTQKTECGDRLLKRYCIAFSILSSGAFVLHFLPVLLRREKLSEC